MTAGTKSRPGTWPAAAAAALTMLIVLMLTTSGNPATADANSDPDSTRAGAVALGDITGQDQAKGGNRSIDGVNDVVDYYSFSLTATREVMVRLTEMERNADLFLEDQDGNVLASSVESGTADEAIFHDLGAGTYYIRVKAMQRGSNIYRLQYKATEPVQEEDDPTPVNSPATGAPTISGTPERGQTLTAGTSGISDDNGLTNAQFAFQWIRNDGNDDDNIPGASGSTYALTSADVNHTVKVRVSFTDDDGYSETLTSAATAEVVAIPATPSRPTIESVAHNSVTIAWNDPGDTSITGYQVLRRNPAVHDSGVFDVIEDDTGSSDTRYTDTTVSPETTYRYRVKARNAHGLSEWSEPAKRFTTPADPTPPNVAATGQPTITGTEQVGDVLTADTSGISDDNGLTSPGFTYQWIRNDGNSDADIPGATGSTYTLTNADVNHTIKVKVSFTDDDGYDEEATSAATGNVNRPPNALPTGLPAITGTPEVGQVLRADTSGIADANGLTSPGFSYQWLRSDGDTDTPVSGETGKTYTVLASDTGSAFKVRVSFTDDHGYSHTLVSDATSAAAASTYSGRTYTELSGGSFHMCGIATDGSVHCWGQGNRGQTDAPEGSYKALASGSAHTCAIATDGSIDLLGLGHVGAGYPSDRYVQVHRIALATLVRHRR